MRTIVAFFVGVIFSGSLLVGALSTAAQTPTPRATAPPTVQPESPFQTVQVGDFAYQVDPYYPGVLYLTKRVEELSGPSVVTSTISFQPFIRQGEQMVAGQAYDTHDSALTRDVRVGSALICTPQQAQP